MGQALCYILEIQWWRYNGEQTDKVLPSNCFQSRRKETVGELYEAERKQTVHPQIMPLWHKDCFELNAAEKQ